MPLCPDRERIRDFVRWSVVCGHLLAFSRHTEQPLCQRGALPRQTGKSRWTTRTPYVAVACGMRGYKFVDCALRTSRARWLLLTIGRAMNLRVCENRHLGTQGCQSFPDQPKSPAVRPPSMEMVCPVTYLAGSPQRNATSGAYSSGEAARCIGMRAIACSLCADVA
jgi:hypothetical protein